MNVFKLTLPRNHHGNFKFTLHAGLLLGALNQRDMEFKKKMF